MHWVVGCLFVDIPELQCPPLEVANAVLSNADFTDYEGTVTVTCDDGYALVGERTVNCLLDQTYDSTPTCQGSLCFHSIHNYRHLIMPCGQGST